MSPIIMHIFCQFFANFELEKSITLWTFGFEVNCVIWNRIILINGNGAFSSFCICLPFYITFCISVQLYKCSEIFLKYNRVLQAELRNSSKNLIFLKEFFDVTELVRNLNQELTNFSFFIIFYGLEGIFKVLLTIYLKEMQNYEHGYIVIVLYYFICSTTMVVIYTICSSMISENIMKIRSTER